MEREQNQVSSEAWQLAESSFEIDQNAVRETLFALGNGYIGLRGTHEERFDGFEASSIEGTFINGFYESSPLRYPETAYGLAKEHQFMLNVPNAKCINFSIEGEEFDLFTGEIVSYERSLDFRTGVLIRKLEWKSPAGRRLSVTSRRLVPFRRKNIFAIEYEVKLLNCSGTITLASVLDDGAKEVEEEGKPRYGAAVASVGGVTFDLLGIEQMENFSALIHRTRNSRLVLVSAIENDLVSPSGNSVKKETISTDQRYGQIYRARLEENGSICLTKFGAYFTSRDYPESELIGLAKKALKEARQVGFDALCAEQKEFLSEFWHYADNEIRGDDALNQGVHFNQFHLLQSVGRDGHTSIAAKGLTGEGYGGHYFWDAETYALPFYLYTRPEIARRMLEYRYSILDKARTRAREMSHSKGALYAWRTIAGEECSAYFPGGTAQYHINADIAYAVKQYHEATLDEEFMTKYGAEIVLETARIWIGIGSYIPKKNNQFCINEVTGPDEYTAMVNNNFYTNAMAQMHLKFAADIAAKMKKSQPTEFERLKTAIGLTDDEPKEWVKAALAMYLPYDQELGIHPQDDTFLYKKVWNLAENPRKSHDLPLHYHYLVIYRHQVCKQADVVLADFLLGDHFSAEDKKRDYDYYEAITTHDSSLSHCTFSVMASEIGYYDKAYQYFMKTARGDLDNLHKNTSYGVHVASMAGTWMAVVCGFGGMRAYQGKLQFAPYLPEKWEQYAFRIYFQSKLVLIEVDKNEVRYRLLEGDALQFSHYGTPIQLTKAAPVHVAKAVANKKAVAR
ncbi:MAG: family 65 glycosyl hydrolase [Candidatus Melainabacteria bacterium]|nr:MAG: family 65 glycosyl hydrolase [Candidatus Melainabacteria bacterium]